MRQAKLGDFLAKRSRGIVPASTPAETFELYSVPAFETKRPEVVTGAEIGSNKQIVEPGTVLLCKINPRINRAWTVGSFTKHQKIASTEWITFPPHPDVEPRYLANYLSRKEIRDYLAANASGVGGSLMRVKASTVEDLPLPLPNVVEQRRIVAEIEKQFSRLDEAVANLKRVKANLKRYKAAVLQSAVDGQLVSADADSPSKWVWGTCGDVIESIQAGASFKCAERPPIAGEVGVVKVSAVTWGEFDEDESKTCLDPTRIREALFIRSGDFLFSRANTIELVGACVIARSVTKSLMLSDKILRFRLVAGLAPEWLLICLQSRFGRSEIERLATGNQESMRNIGQDRIRQIRLPLPTPTEQRRIVAEVDGRLSIIREVEAEVDGNLKRAQVLRASTLATVYAMRQ